MDEVFNPTKANKTTYDSKYNRQFIRVKHVQFNIKDQDQVKLLNWLDSKPSKNAYLIELIRADYERNLNDV